MDARAVSSNTCKYKLRKKDSPISSPAYSVVGGKKGGGEKKKKRKNFEDKDALFQLSSSRGIFLGAKCTTEKWLCTTRDSSSLVMGEHQSVAKKKIVKIRQCIIKRQSSSLLPTPSSQTPKEVKIGNTKGICVV